MAGLQFGQFKRGCSRAAHGDFRAFAPEAGAAVGIETGPGALLTGLAGGLFFGAVGFWAGDKVADTISPN